MASPAGRAARASAAALRGIKPALVRVAARGESKVRLAATGGSLRPSESEGCPRTAGLLVVPSGWSPELLRALRARTSGHPDNPGLIASWPRVREDRMASACAELFGRGHPVFGVSIPSTNPGATRDGWAVGATTEEPSCQA